MHNSIPNFQKCPTEDPWTPQRKGKPLCTIPSNNLMHGVCTTHFGVCQYFSSHPYKPINTRRWDFGKQTDLLWLGSAFWQMASHHLFVVGTHLWQVVIQHTVLDSLRHMQICTQQSQWRLILLFTLVLSTREKNFQHAILSAHKPMLGLWQLFTSDN